MQKGKAKASSHAMSLQTRAPQQSARGPPPSQQRSDDVNPRQVQPYQRPGEIEETAAKETSQTPQEEAAVVAAKDIKKKKKKHRLKEIEKRSSEKGMDLMEAYMEEPVEEEAPGETEETAGEQTTQTPQEEAESWSPELVWETEPSRPEGRKITYERDFLLQFQSNPLCQIKPEGLPDLEVVLGQARTTSKSGFLPNRMQKSDGVENMFLPSFMRQQSRNKQSGSRGARKMNTQPKKEIDFPRVQPQVEHPVDSENISLGPGGRGYGAWARGSSGGSGAAGAGAGPSTSAVAASATGVDNRPANRYSSLAGQRKHSAPAKMSSEDPRRQVDFSLPMGSPAQMQYHRPQQPMQGQFAPVSGPSQPQGSPYFQPTTVYQVGQPTPPMYIVRAPPGPMTGMPQYQTQTFEPRARERKIIQIKDPNSIKDVTQEILKRQPSGSLTRSTGGTPNNITPDISGQSSSSSTPPLTLQQQAEANVRAQFAAQVAATLVNSEDKPKKPEVIIHKAPVNSKAVVDTVQLKETTITRKNEVVKETRTNLATGTDTQLLPEANIRAQFAAQVAAKGEPKRELTEVHCDESKISQEHLEELRMGKYYIRSDLTTQLMEMKERLEITDELLKVTEEQLRRSEDQLREKDERQQTLQRQLITLRAEKQTQEEENEKLQDQLSVKLEEFAYLEKEFRDSVQDQVDLKRELSVANEKLRKYESQLMTRDWIISRDEIEIMLDNCLGDGGYGKVFRGRCRGFVVAVKTFKDFSLKDGGRDLFEREMDIASRCRHPCLLQFIGATQEEKPLFVTELMELSLRKLLKERPLSEKEILVISLDVAHALNYLHNRKIVHRDVSSANVLLWKQNDQWRGKLGDYGTVKFLQEIMTKSPGAMIYSAPEAGSPFHQTVKIDVYSFGVLFGEMFTRRIPVFDERKKHIDLVPNRPGREFQDLVLRCTEEDPTRRPSMEIIIKKMETFITTVQN